MKEEKPPAPFEQSRLFSPKSKFPINNPAQYFPIREPEKKQFDKIYEDLRQPIETIRRSKIGQKPFFAPANLARQPTKVDEVKSVFDNYDNRLAFEKNKSNFFM